MKGMRKTLVISAACALMTTAASALDVADTKVYIGSNIRSMTSMYDGGGFNAMANSLFVGFKNDQWRFEIDPTLSYRQNERKQVNKTERTTVEFGLDARVYYDFPALESMENVTPFVGGGLGFLSVSDEQKNPKVKFQDSLQYGIGAGGGVSLSFLESWSFDVELVLQCSTREDKAPNPKVTETNVGFDLGMKLRYMF